MSLNEEDQSQVGEHGDISYYHGSPLRSPVGNDDMSPAGGGTPIGFLSPVHRGIFHDHQPSPEHPEINSPPNFHGRTVDQRRFTFKDIGRTSREGATNASFHRHSHHMPDPDYRTHNSGYPPIEPRSYTMPKYSEGKKDQSYHGYVVPTQQSMSNVSFESHGSGHFPHPYNIPPQPYPAYSHGPMSSHGYYNWVSEPPQKPVEYIRDIKPSDVLCGRGGATNSHSGNRSFRALVKRYQEQYLKAKKRDKPSVADKLIDIVRERGGRFLKRAESQQYGEILWVDIGDERAREKTCQALREGAPELRRRKGKGRGKALDDDETTGDDSHDDDTLSNGLVNTELVNNQRYILGSGLTERFGYACTSDRRNAEAINKADARDDEGSQQMETSNFGKGPIMIQPYKRLTRRKMEEISVEGLTQHERELYLGAFLPPHPPLNSGTRRKRKIIIARSPSAFEETATDSDDDYYENRDIAEV